MTPLLRAPSWVWPRGLTFSSSPCGHGEGRREAWPGRPRRAGRACGDAGLCLAGDTGGPPESRPKCRALGLGGPARPAVQDPGPPGKGGSYEPWPCFAGSSVSVGGPLPAATHACTPTCPSLAGGRGSAQRVTARARPSAESSAGSCSPCWLRVRGLCLEMDDHSKSHLDTPASFFFIPKTAFNEGKIKRFIKAVFWNESNMLVFANFRTA